MAAAKCKIPGHSDAVLCCHVMPAGKLLVSGGEDGQLCFTDLSALSGSGKIQQKFGDAVTSVCSSPAADHLVYASAGQAVLAVDMRKGFTSDAVCDTWQLNQDEINSIAVNRQGNWLAAADDSGEVQVVNLQQPGGASGRPTYKTLRRGHSNIVSSVAFRPHRPWELVSGGLDSTVVRWDFNRLRPLQTWSLSAEAGASGGQVFNPPMVHSVVVPDTEERSLCRLMGVGRGDGYISLYDIDTKPSLPPGLASSGSGSSNGGSSKKKGKGKASSDGSSGGDGSKTAAAELSGEGAAAGPSGLGAAAGGAAAGGPGDAAAAQAAWRVPFVPGRIALLGREQGGHSAAVNCLAFMAGTHCQRLLSAGNDGRLILWDWQAAAARQGAAWWGPTAAAAAGSGRQETGGAGETAAAREEGGDAPPGAAAVVVAEGSGSAAEEAPVVAADVRHGRKINWVCTCEPAGGYNVIVADVTQRMTALALR